MFIELTKSGRQRSLYKILINSERIDYVASDDVSGEGSFVHTSSDIHHVKESYDEIKEMLTPKMPVIVSDDGDMKPISPGYKKLDWSKIKMSEPIIDLNESLSSTDSELGEIYHNMSKEDKENLESFSGKILDSLGIPPEYLIKEDVEGL